MLSKITCKCLFLVCVLIGLKLFGQEKQFKKYKYEDFDSFHQIAFSFEIPNSWEINNEYDGTGYFLNCTNSEKLNTDCLNRIIFKIKYVRHNLDTALLKMGVTQRNRSDKLPVWETIGNDSKPKIIKPTIRKNDNYSSVTYAHKDIIACENGVQNWAKGSRQFIYFSDGQQTICFVTLGKDLEEKIFVKILDSFKFYKTKTQY